MNDPSFEAFRKQLGAVAEKKDRKALAGLVAQNFFWMGEKGDKADKKKPGVDNLAKAIQLDGKDAPGWEMLGAASADPTGMPFPDRKDTICAPADPTFNPQELEALAKSTGTEEGDWAYPTQPGLEVRSGPQPNCAGGREARPAFRPCDGGQTRRATSRARCCGWSRRPARPASCRPRR